MERDHLFYMANLGVEVRRFWGAKERGDENAAMESRARMTRPLESLRLLFAGTPREQELQALTGVIDSEPAIVSYFVPFEYRMARRIAGLA